MSSAASNVDDVTLGERRTGPVRLRERPAPEAGGAAGRAEGAAFGPIIFGGFIVAVLFYAWLVREEGHLTAETGAGYWLGIAGASIMLILFIYPLRKRWRILHGLGRVSNWFRMHMVLGVVGPALIVLHSNFKLGSLNSTFALFTMLTVVASGLVGRFLYFRIHRGFSGAKLAMNEVTGEVARLETDLGRAVDQESGVLTELHALTERVSVTPGSLGQAVLMALVNGFRIRRTRARARKGAATAVRAVATNLTWRERRQRQHEVDDALKLYFAAARRASRLMLFERLFALWHAFHLPLFILLLLTTVIHIVAVHLY